MSSVVKNESWRSLTGETSAASLNRGVRRKTRRWVATLTALVLISAVLCVGIGPAPVDPHTVVAVIAHHAGWPTSVTWTPAEEAIVWNLRAPRVALGLLVGAALAISGLVLQAMVRNVLADPYVLGISSGASTGAAAAMLFGVTVAAGQYMLPAGAFAGALAASLMVFTLARHNGHITSSRLLLSGIATGYALSAVTSLLIFASDDAEGSRSVMFWMLGSLALAQWDVTLGLVCAVLLPSVALLWLWSPRLDALSVGDETARAVGLNPNLVRVQLLVVASLCTGTAVAAAGIVGFVGLVVPHLARRITGGAHARLLPVTALLGAGMLIWADALGRMVMQPRELPIGIVTALLGAPFLLILIRRTTRRQS